MRNANLDLTGSSKPQEPRSGPFPQRARKVSDWVTLDMTTSYTFGLPASALAQVPGLAKDGGKNVKLRDGKEGEYSTGFYTAEYNPCGWARWF